MLMQGAGPDSEATLAALAANTQAVNAAAAALGQQTTQTSQQKDTTWTKLFVGGLPYHTTDKSLREHFAVYGEIEEAVVITDRQTNKSRGYGFVIMGDRASAERACKDPNPIIDGRKANVNLAILGAKPRGTVTPSEMMSSTYSGKLQRSDRARTIPTPLTTTHVISLIGIKFVIAPHPRNLILTILCSSLAEPIQNEGHH